MKYLWGILLFLFFVVLILFSANGCMRWDTYPIHISGYVIEKNIVQIDTIREKYWQYIVIQTDGGTKHILDVESDLWRNVNEGDFISIMFRNNGEIHSYAYGERVEGQ